MDKWVTLIERRRKLPPEAVFACSTAAWMHGLDLTSTERLEVMLPRTTSIRSSIGLTVRRSCLRPEEVTAIKGLPATTLHRTLRDLALFCKAVEALIAMDAAVRKRLTTREKMARDPATAPGRRGAARFRKLIELAEPAESPMETRLRWILLEACLPRPQVQTELREDDGTFLGRADLYYPAARVVIEFDGGNHRERLVADDRRQNLLTTAGYRVLRFTSADIYQRPAIVEGQVRAALAA